MANYVVVPAKVLVIFVRSSTYSVLWHVYERSFGYVSSEFWALSQLPISLLLSTEGGRLVLASSYLYVKDLIFFFQPKMGRAELNNCWSKRALEQVPSDQDLSETVAIASNIDYDYLVLEDLRKNVSLRQGREMANVINI